MARWSSRGTFCALLLCATSLIAQSPESAQPLVTNVPIRLARAETRRYRETMPDDELLFRWQRAHLAFCEVAALIPNEKLRLATDRLQVLQKELPAPYGERAAKLCAGLLQTWANVNQQVQARGRSFNDYVAFASVCHELGSKEAALATLRKAFARGLQPPANLASFKNVLAMLQWDEQVLLDLIAELNDSRAKNACRMAIRKLGSQTWLERMRANLRHYHQAIDGLGTLHELYEERSQLVSTDEHTEVYRIIIRALSEAGHEAEAHAWECKLLIDFQDSPDVPARFYLDRGVAAFERGEEALAIQDFERVCRDYPRSNWRYFAARNLGRIFQSQRHFDSAISCYLKLFPYHRTRSAANSASRSDPGNVHFARHDAARALAECYEVRNEVTKALEWLEASIDTFHLYGNCGVGEDKEHRRTQTWRARLLVKLHRYQEAYETVEPIVCQDSSLAEPALILVDLAHQLGNFDELPERLKAARLRNPVAQQLPRRRFPPPLNETSIEIALRYWLARFAAEEGNCPMLWTMIRRSQLTAHEVYLDDAGIELTTYPLTRRMADLLITMDEAGPFLLSKLQSGDLERGWAIVLLGRMNHPEALRLLGNAASRIFTERPQHFSRGLCGDVQYAILARNTPELLELRRQYPLILAMQYLTGSEAAMLNGRRVPASRKQPMRMASP